MASLRILAALLVVCVAQNVACAQIGNRQEEGIALKINPGIFGVKPFDYISCLPKIADVYKWYHEFGGFFQEFRDINDRSYDARRKCGMLPITDTDARQKCFKEAEKKTIAEKTKLFEEADVFLAKTYGGYVRFRACLKDSTTPKPSGNEENKPENKENKPENKENKPENKENNIKVN